MYNRYLTGAGAAAPDDRFVEPEEIDAAGPEEGEAKQTVKLLPDGGGEPHGEHKAETSLIQTGRSLLRSLHIPDLTFDDLLLIAIIFLLLRESDDDDIIIILGALFFTGFFK